MEVDTRDYVDQLKVLEAQREQIFAQKLNANKEFKRVNNLFKQNIVSQSKFDSRHTNLNSLTATLKSIDAQIRIINHKISDTKLLAPYDCVVASQFAEAHEIINPGVPVISVSDVSHFEVEAYVPENEIVKVSLKKGEKASLHFNFLPVRKFDISLKEWCIEADPITRTYKVVFKLNPPEDIHILPGMTGEIVWQTTGKESESHLIVPALSVATNHQGQAFVWVYDQKLEKATKRRVKIGSIFGHNSFIVKSGLTVGEKIIAKGADLIHSNDLVKFVLEKVSQQ
jgi:RND family efflux transporter MFP subunit